MANRDEQREAVLKAAKDHHYEIKGLSTFLGMEECGGYNVSLYRDGRRVAFIINDDSGGETQWDFFRYKGEDAGARADEEERLLNEICVKLPPDDIDVGNGRITSLDCDRDIFLCHLIEELEETQYWKKLCRKSTCFTLKSQNEGQYMKVKIPYSKALAVHIRSKHGDDLAEIINERFLKPVPA